MKMMSSALECCCHLLFVAIFLTISLSSSFYMNFDLDLVTSIVFSLMAIFFVSLLVFELGNFCFSTHLSRALKSQI